MSDPDGFPWPPLTFSDIMYNGDLLRNDGTSVKCDEIKSKVKGVYFSAHWVSCLLFLYCCFQFIASNINSNNMLNYCSCSESSC